jgi:outer membrane protein assembly factor BamE (lipoprotein component of BamABCDE complex)
MRACRLLALSLAVLLGLAACGGLKFGREFPSPRLDSIKNGTTTKADLQKVFGDPTEVGLEDGDETWTWFYAKQGSGSEMSKNLKVRFAKDGKVGSHSFSSSFPEDMKTLR